MPTPKIVLMTTDHTATYAVSCSATTMSGSWKSRRIDSKPSSKVLTATSDTGHATRKNR